MTIREEIRIEVAYALQNEQVLLSVCLPHGATVEEAIRHSGVLAKFPEINLATHKVGVFSKLVKLDASVRDKDRVEIYRPLIADPKAVRRQRADAGKSRNKGGGKTAGSEQSAVS